MATAILIDGAFFLDRYNVVIRSAGHPSPPEVAKNLFRWALAHLEDKDHGRRELYRILALRQKWGQVVDLNPFQHIESSLASGSC